MSSPLNPIVSSTPAKGVEFRVIIRGLKLDAATRQLIDSAIRSAVLHELATIDGGAQSRILEPADDPHTRLPLLGGLLPLGLVVVAQTLLEAAAKDEANGTKK